MAALGRTFKHLQYALKAPRWKHSQAMLRPCSSTVSRVANAPYSSRQHSISLEEEKARATLPRYLHSMVEIGVMKTFIDHRVFDAIPESGAISIVDLAQATKIDQGLLRRYSRFLVAAGTLDSTSDDQVAHTATSRQFCGEAGSVLIFHHLYDFTLLPIIQWPEYFRRHGLQEPLKSKQIPIGLATGQPDKSFYDVLEATPAVADRFNRAMATVVQGMPATGMYDFRWVEDYAQSTPSTRPLLVDVGGGKGQALRAILEENQGIPPDKCILEDRAAVIEDASCEKGQLTHVRKVAASFFEEQPVQGALIYHIRRVLNDWPDEECVHILQRLRTACASDSRILVSEQLLPKQASLHLAALDLFFMNFGGKRRSEKEYGEMAVQAGLRMQAVFRDPGSDSAVIELVPI